MGTKNYILPKNKDLSGGSKNVKRGPYFSVKLFPGSPYFSKNMDCGVQICHDRPWVVVAVVCPPGWNTRTSIYI